MVITSISAIIQLNEAINNDLDKLDTSIQGNKLTLNVAKTKFMLAENKPKHEMLQNQISDMDTWLYKLATKSLKQPN